MVDVGVDLHLYVPYTTVGSCFQNNAVFSSHSLGSFTNFSGVDRLDRFISAVLCSGGEVFGMHSVGVASGYPGNDLSVLNVKNVLLGNSIRFCCSVHSEFNLGSGFGQLQRCLFFHLWRVI